MDRSLLTRALTILAVVGLFSYWAFPPQEKINLGLDLRGGMHLVLQVETDDALKFETDNRIEEIQRRLEDEEIRGVTVDRVSNSLLEVNGVPADKRDFFEDEIVDRNLVGWSMREVGDRIRLELSDAESKNIRQTAVNQARETIRNRVGRLWCGRAGDSRRGIGQQPHRGPASGCR